MKKIAFILVCLFVLTGTGVHAQFWKKKEKGPASAKAGKYESTEYRDAFSRKNKKGPNVKTTKPPVIKSRKNMYKHATSKKIDKKRNKREQFYAKKKRYKNVKKKSGDSFSNQPSKSRGGRKSGSSGKGIFKGRKK